MGLARQAGGQLTEPLSVWATLFVGNSSSAGFRATAAQRVQSGVRA